MDSISTIKYEYIPRERQHAYKDKYQLMLRNYMSRSSFNDNLLVFHGIGTGKTCVAVSIAEGYKEYIANTGRKAVVLVKNKFIKENFITELRSKCSDMDIAESLGMYTFITFGSFVNKILGRAQYDAQEKKTIRADPVDTIQNLSDTLVIVDEAHNITGNTMYTALDKILQRSTNYRLVLLTATPVYDSVSEIFDLMKLMNKHDDKTPSQRTLKDSVESGRITRTGKTVLVKYLKGKVSYLPPNTESFPYRLDLGVSVDGINVVECEMSDHQRNVYSTVYNSDDTNQDSLFKNASDAATIVYPDGSFGRRGYTKNTVGLPNILRDGESLRKCSSKLFTLLHDLKDTTGTSFVYSNFVSEGGTQLIRNLLLANGYLEFKVRDGGAMYSQPRFVILDENKTVSLREKYRGIFNSKENINGSIIKVIVGSPVTSEGITFKHVRSVHVLEPTWNFAKLEQIIGRSIRNGSHDLLPPADRRVVVYKYASKGTIDIDKYKLCAKKRDLNAEVDQVLKEVSITCPFVDDTVTCKYTLSDDIDILFDSFDTHIEFFEESDIAFIISNIRELFGKYFIWNIDSIVSYINSRDNGISVRTIFYTLHKMAKNKLPITDQYDRQGFLVRSGPLFAFNPLGFNTNDTLFNKYFNFESRKSVMTLSGYASAHSQSQMQSNATATSELDIISQQDIEYNDNIVLNQKIYGTYRKKAIGRSTSYGPKDGKFRIAIVDKNIQKFSKDMRKLRVGKVALTYDTNDLRLIAKELGLSYTVDSSKQDLIDSIHDKLQTTNAILK